MKSPITWVGGKFYLASWIISFFPEHRHYIEIFAGALHTLFAKTRSWLETVNDLDGGLVNFWMVCRDQPDELIRKLDHTPYSRTLYYQWKGQAMPEDDPVEWAARWYFLNGAAVNSFQGGGWSYTRHPTTVHVPPPSRFRRRVDRLLPACDRLAEVQIECRDFRVIIERFGDDEDNFLYCDPPYPDCQWYKHNFTEEDHRDLAELAKAAQAKIMISYREHPLIRELYSDWNIESSERVSHAKVVKTGGEKTKSIELLIMNYQVQPRFDFGEVSSGETEAETV